MRQPNTVVSVVLGLALGVAMAALGLWLGGRGDPVAAAPPPSTVDTTTSTAPAVEARWVAPDEVLLGPTALVPTGLLLGDGELELAYDLVDIAPPPIGLPGPNAAHSAAAPELWTLLTTDGNLEAMTTAAGRTARFELPDGFDPGSITGARIDAWRIRLPVTHRLAIAHDDLGEHVLEPGTSVALRLILVQSQNTLVQFRVEHPVDGFSGGATTFSAAFEAQPFIEGRGPGWTNTGITETGAQLTYVGGELPDPIRISVNTHEWWTVTDFVAVDLTGVPVG